MNIYLLIIEVCIVIIVSALFNVIAKKTKIPSVLMLLALGLVIQQLLKNQGVGDLNWMPMLQMLGTIGLIMIVLEAALDLELKREKWPIIWKSALVALFSMLATSVIIGFIFATLLNTDLLNAMLYAVPLSIISSAIIIPSVASIKDEHKREFMIYESTFSDIFGIMVFYFLISNAEATSAKEMGIDIISNIGITLLISFVVSYLLVFLIQNIRSQVKLFLLIAVLVLFYSVAKMFHLSSLLIVLVFGLILRNRSLFFFGPLKKLIKEDTMNDIFKNFNMITMESAFMLRTFFFVVFGITISLSTLANVQVVLVSIAIIAIIFAIRYVWLWLFVRKDLKLQLFLAPRGLITILLFFAIPAEFQIKEFNQGILLFVIIFTSIIMAWALIKDSKKVIEPEEDVIEDGDTSEKLESNKTLIEDNENK